MPEPTTYREGQTATNPKTGQRVVFRNGQWVADTSKPAKAETTAADRKELIASSERARIERDSMRSYADASKAVTDFDTGPAKAWWMDAITNDEDDGIVGSIAANTLGLFARPLVSDQTMAARDHLKTVNARVSLASSAQLKGVASDRDMGLLRLTGVSPSKSVTENRRIIQEARMNSGLEQYRAKMKARWVSKYGSLAAPAANGRSFEEVAQVSEAAYIKDYREGIARGGPKPKPKPKAPPPGARRKPSGGPVTIDINGNPIR